MRSHLRWLAAASIAAASPADEAAHADEICSNGVCAKMMPSTDRPGYVEVDLRSALPGMTHYNLKVEGGRQLELRYYSFYLAPGQRNFSVQACARGGLGQRSTCTPWANFAYKPPPQPQPAPALMEWNTDRPGGDYHNMDLGKGMTHDSCRDICKKDGKCLAYAYVKAGVQGPNPRCWLKDSIPAAKKSDCCISGVVRKTPVASKPRPAPQPPPLEKKDLIGVWDTQTGDGAKYTLIIERQGDTVAAFLGSVDPKLDGTVKATLSNDGRQMTFILVQPKINLTSRGQISLAGNGDSFEGRITADAKGVPLAWTGKRRK